MQTMLNFSVDYLHHQVLKPYTDLFLKTTDARSLEAECALSTWLRGSAIEGTLAPALGLYLQNELIQFRLGENVKLIMRTVQALQSANLSIQ
jgi:hypothetical protein